MFASSIEEAAQKCQDVRFNLAQLKQEIPQYPSINEQEWKDLEEIISVPCIPP